MPWVEQQAVSLGAPRVKSYMKHFFFFSGKEGTVSGLKGRIRYFHCVGSGSLCSSLPPLVMYLIVGTSGRGSNLGLNHPEGSEQCRLPTGHDMGAALFPPLRHPLESCAKGGLKCSACQLQVEVVSSLLPIEDMY